MATNSLIGEVSIFAGEYVPSGWEYCRGQIVAKSASPALYNVLGDKFGATPTTFHLPDLTGSIALNQGTQFPFAAKGGEAAHQLTVAELPAHTHQAFGLTTLADTGSPANAFWAAAGDGHYAPTADTKMADSAIGKNGDNQTHPNMPPYMALNFGICTTSSGPRVGSLGEIILFAGTSLPPDVADNWMPCDGRLVAIAGNTALYSLIGNAFGGDGKLNFALPDLRDRVPVCSGTGIGLTPRLLGQTGGETAVTLTDAQMPKHNHVAHGSGLANSIDDPAGATWGRNAVGRDEIAFYGSSGNETPLSVTALDVTGGGGAHNNMPPYLALNYYICVLGDYPTQS